MKQVAQMNPKILNIHKKIHPIVTFSKAQGRILLIKLYDTEINERQWNKRKLLRIKK